jgi:hypothetical protein
MDLLVKYGLEPPSQHVARAEATDIPATSLFGALTSDDTPAA